MCEADERFAAAIGGHSTVRLKQEAFMAPHNQTASTISANQGSQTMPLGNAVRNSYIQGTANQTALPVSMKEGAAVPSHTKSGSEAGDAKTRMPGSMLIFIASLLLVLVSSASVLHMMLNNRYGLWVYGKGVWNLPMLALFAMQFALGVFGFKYRKNAEKGKWLFFMAVCILAANITVSAIWSMMENFSFGLWAIMYVLGWPSSVFYGFYWSIFIFFLYALFLAGTHMNSRACNELLQPDSVFSRKSIRNRLNIAMSAVITLAAIISIIALLSTYF